MRFVLLSAAGHADIRYQSTAEADILHRTGAGRHESIEREIRPGVLGFTNASLSPKRIEEIANENIRTKNQMKFSALFRMERTFKSLEFCQ
jgi:hypothetical protein